MQYTVRYAHLAACSDFKVGDIIHQGDVIGKMGNTGQSTAPHLHMDAVEGRRSGLWSLYDMEVGIVPPAHKQINFFIDAELFGIEERITTHYNDPKYMARFKKVHLGYDLVPRDCHVTDEHYYIRWNRSMPGEVLAFGFHSGYGYYLLVGFKT